MPKKTKTPPSQTFSIRLSRENKAWLTETAARHNVGISTIMIWALEALQQYADAHDGTIPTPINVHQLWGLISEAHPDLHDKFRCTLAQAAHHTGSSSRIVHPEPQCGTGGSGNMLTTARYL